MTTFNTFSVMLRAEISALLEPLLATAQQPGGVQLLLQSLGRSDALSSRADLRTEIERLATLAQGLTSLADETLESWAGLTKVLTLARDLFTALQRLEHLVSDPALAEQCRDLGRDLVQYLLALHLRAHHPTLFRAANLLTLITPLELTPRLPAVLSGSEMVRLPRHADQFHLDRITDLLKQPLPTLAAHYFPNGLATAADAHEAGRRLFPVLTLLAQALGLSSFSDHMRAIPDPESPPPPEDIEVNHFSGSEPGEAENPVFHVAPEPVDLTPYFETFFPRFGLVLPGQQAPDGSVTPARFALSVLMSSARHPGGARGLVLTPLGQLDWSEVRDGWRLALESSGQVPAFVLGPGGISKAPTDSPLTAATARLVLERVAEAGAPAFSVGVPAGTRLEIGALRCTTDVRVTPSDSSLALAADALSGVFVLAPGDGDGFLQAILPDDGLTCAFDLGVALSSTHGLRLRGAAGLEATVPVGLSVGGVTIPALYLGLHASAQGLTAEVSANANVSIGPVAAVIERIGLTAAVIWPETGGNLGIADLSLGFKPPTGVGLSIDAPGVTGGGFLSFDTDQGQYAGVVHLQLESGLAIKGLGLIATRLPNHAKGFSLLVLISAEGFQPIPLGLGFTLTGLGGLLALNRTFNEDVLRAGLKNHTLDSVLFPPDPVRNAPQILSTLQNVFPVASGHHLFGPVARLTWGTPPLLTADLGLVLEFGKRLRLLLLGQITAILPRRDNDLIRLQMDTMGVIDFDQGTAALDATLYDSRLLKKFVLTGDMAMRLRCEGSPSFALAIGGLHPAFNPPPNFPKLERLSLNLASGDNLRLRCESYFALTSNTVQFGSHTELYARAAGFSLQGAMGYDVLIQLDPFQFLADFYAQVQLKRGAHNLFKIRVEGALAGPRPLHLTGKATFEVLWMDVTLRIDKTLVAGEKPPRPAPVEVLPLLKAALGQPDNWVARLPDGQRAMVTLRPRPGVANEVALHPLGTLTVKQNVVPLNLDITRFGQTTPAGARRFTISGVSLGGQNLPVPPPIRDFFAPAQFFDLSDDAKLSWPSFQALDAGVSFGADTFTFSDQADDWLEVAALTFDTITVDPETHASQVSSPTEAYALSPALLDRQARFGAAGASALRRTGKARYRTARVGYHVVKEGWSLVDTATLAVLAVPGREAVQPLAYAEAAEALRYIQQETPAQARRWQILRLSELQMATPDRA